jgi:formate/nitrite transporter FocA (FNT family)
VPSNTVFMAEQTNPGTSKVKQVEEEAHERSSPQGKVVYHAILEEGEDELERPSSALFWSGLAAGLSMGFSLIAEGLLRAELPDAPWRPLISKFGYSLGFLIVVLGRQQLFTENTLTPILPLLKHKSWGVFGNVMRLWLVVFSSNMIGALAVAWAIAGTSAFSEHTRHVLMAIGSESTEPAFGTVIIRGIFAGWLIALMVWLLPYAEAARVHVIVLITYVIGLGHFSHVIAGSVSVFTAAAGGHITWGHAIGGFVVPSLIGNILGGVTLVAALNHAQVAAGSE